MTAADAEYRSAVVSGNDTAGLAAHRRNLADKVAVLRQQLPFLQNALRLARERGRSKLEAKLRVKVAEEQAKARARAEEIKKEISRLIAGPIMEFMKSQGRQQGIGGLSRGELDRRARNCDMANPPEPKSEPEPFPTELEATFGS